MHTALGAQYEPYLLDLADIDAFMALQESALHEIALHGRPHHIKPRTADDIAAHINAGMQVIGVRHIHTGRHIAHALLTDPARPEGVHLAGYPLAADATRIVQSFYIHPDHRYRQLPDSVRNVCYPAGLIFQTARTIAENDGATRLLAKIAEDNPQSIKSFERGGFTHLSATGIDPVKGYAVRYVSAILTPPQPVHPVPSGVTMDVPFFPAIIVLEQGPIFA